MQSYDEIYKYYVNKIICADAFDFAILNGVETCCTPYDRTARKVTYWLRSNNNTNSVYIVNTGFCVYEHDYGLNGWY